VRRCQEDTYPELVGLFSEVFEKISVIPSAFYDLFGQTGPLFEGDHCWWESLEQSNAFPPGSGAETSTTLELLERVAK
jgi:hypothetical protein